MAHPLHPAVIFSPSKAHQAASAAREWKYVDAWLATKFRGCAPPPFERNADTLKVLFALAALNEAADEEHDALASAEAAAVDELVAFTARAVSSADCPPSDELPLSGPLQAALLDAVEVHLSSDGKAALDSIAATAVCLGMAHPDSEQVGQEMLLLRAQVLAIGQMHARVRLLNEYLNQQLVATDAISAQWKHNASRPASDVVTQNLELQRKNRLMAAQLGDHDEQPASTTADWEPKYPTIDDIATKERAWHDLLARREDVEAKLEPFNNLPTDPNLARTELDRVRRELAAMTQKRDSLFEALVETESPIKPRR